MSQKTLRIEYKHKTEHCFLWESYQTHKQSVQAKFRVSES